MATIKRVTNPRQIAFNSRMAPVYVCEGCKEGYPGNRKGDWRVFRSHLTKTHKLTEDQIESVYSALRKSGDEVTI